MTILMEYRDVRFAPHHTVEFYRRLLFGTVSGPGTDASANIAGPGGFFDQSSNGRFHFVDAGVVGPYENPDDPQTPEDESAYECAQGASCSFGVPDPWRAVFGNGVRLAGAGEVDFSRFDTDGNGTVDNSELTVLVIAAVPGGDNVTTTQWPGAPGDVRSPDYRFVQLEGYVYPFRATEEPPAGTSPLYFWYSPTRRDNLSTTHPVWAGAAGDKRPPDYDFSRIDGYIFPPATESSPALVSLHSWYSPSRRDYLLSANPAWNGEPGDTRSPDYEYRRHEGYIFSPDRPAPSGTVPLYRWYSPLGDGAIGSNRGTLPGCVETSGVQVCLAVANGTENMNAAVIAHELTHVIGIPWEDYGATSRNSLYFTIMSLTDGAADGRWIVHTSPWQKILLGWQEPRSIARGSCAAVEIRAEALPDLGVGKNYILYDPARGTDEIFVLEHRFKGSRPGLEKVALHSWYSEARGDNFLSSSANWVGHHGYEHDGYRYSRFEGYADSPSLPRRPGMVPLNLWYSPEREDNFSTTLRDWTGSPGETKDGYYFGGLQGYVHDPEAPPQEGWIPLYSWWSGSREDNLATADPAWAGDPSSTRSPDYRFVRLEGYLDLGLRERNYDADPWSEGSAKMPDEGLGIWYVQKNPTSHIPVVVDLVPGGGTDAANFLYPPGGSWGNPVAGDGLWDASDGAIPLNWLDGTPSGFAIRVLSESVDRPVIRVQIDGSPCLHGSDRFFRGDSNGDARVDISDAISTLGVLFLGQGELTCEDAGDFNDDGKVDISDPIATLGTLFLGQGNDPNAGLGECGPDSTDDALTCESNQACGEP